MPNPYANMQAPDILGNIQKGMSLADMVSQKKRQEQLQKQEDNDKRILRDAVKYDAQGNPTADGSLLSELSNPEKGLAVRGTVSQLQGEAHKRKAEKDKADLDWTVSALDSAKDQASYERVLQAAQARGMDLTGIPTLFDPSFVNNYKMKTLTVKERLDHQLAEERLKLDREKAKTSGAKIPKGYKKVFNPETGETEVVQDTFKTNQTAAATYGLRVKDAHTEIEGLLKNKDTYDPTGFVASVQRSPLFPERFKQQSAKKQDQSERNFVNAILRRESGSAINKDEFSSAEKQYFPRENDSSEVLAQKARNRQVALAGLKTEAGGAWEATEKELAQMGGTKPPSTDVVKYAEKHGISVAEAQAIKDQRTAPQTAGR